MIIYIYTVYYIALRSGLEVDNLNRISVRLAWPQFEFPDIHFSYIYPRTRTPKYYRKSMKENIQKMYF